MDVLERALTGLGFHCRRMKFEDIENLYARRGTASPNLCFAGHTDVVPTGSTEAWSSAPFEAEVKDGILADVAPTLLDLLGVPKPKEMTGSSLLKKRRK